MMISCMGGRVGSQTARVPGSKESEMELQRRGDPSCGGMGSSCMDWVLWQIDFCMV